LIIACFACDEYLRAGEFVARLRRAQPDSARVDGLTAFVYAELGMHEAADVFTRKALARDPKEMWALKVLKSIEQARKTK
jgi:Flp pilus assembly protein TadD